MKLLTAMAGVTVMLVGFAHPASATAPGADGDVAFGFQGSLWRVAEGEDPIEIPGTRSSTHPEWSPDGSSLLYVQSGYVQIRDMASGSVTEVPGMDAVRSADWSPDGAHVLASRRVQGRPATLWTVDLDGSNLTRVAHPGKCSTTGLIRPAWSPDGAHIAYLNASTQTEQCKERAPHVVIRDLDSGERRPMAGLLKRYYDFPAGVAEVDFSANGQELVVYGYNEWEQFGARIDVTSPSVIASAEYFCVSDSDCLDQYQPTPSGGIAVVIHDSAAGGEGPGSARLVVNSVTYGTYYDPDFFVEGDETGFPWRAVSDVDVQPVVP